MARRHAVNFVLGVLLRQSQERARVGNAVPCASIGRAPLDKFSFLILLEHVILILASHFALLKKNKCGFLLPRA